MAVMAALLALRGGGVVAGRPAVAPGAGAPGDGALFDAHGDRARERDGVRVSWGGPEGRRRDGYRRRAMPWNEAQSDSGTVRAGDRGCSGSVGAKSRGGYEGDTERTFEHQGCSVSGDDAVQSSTQIPSRALL